MNWDLSVSWTRTTRTQSQIQEHKPRNLKKKKKNYRSKQIATKYKLDPEKSTL